MGRLSENEEAILTLLAMMPVTSLPPRPYMWALRLRQVGLATRCNNGAWVPTREGLRQLGLSVN